MGMGFQTFRDVICEDRPSVAGGPECPFRADLGHSRSSATETGVPRFARSTPMPVSDLLSQMARYAAVVGARSARIGMFAEGIAAISANCGCVWGRSVGL